MTPDEEARAEYRALVVQVASWCMRRTASGYVPFAQLVKQFADDVTKAAQ